jgi:hypothetical protein
MPSRFSPDEARIFSRLTGRVHKDHQDALRFLEKPAVQAHFRHEPSDRNYIEGSIQTAVEALAKIVRVFDKIRVDEQSKGTLRLTEGSTGL